MTTLAWHFVGDKLRDGRPVPPDGKWLEHSGECIMCEQGLHASRKLIDALGYAPGHVVCRVAVDGIADEDESKLVARRRMILWRIDAEDALREFTRRCALDVIDLWDAPDVVREYLRTGDEGLRAAARDAAWAARDAAWAAAQAASGAARDASWDAGAAAQAKQGHRLIAMVRRAAGNPNDKQLMQAGMESEG